MKKNVRILALILTFILSLSLASFALAPYIGDNYPQVYDCYWNGKVAKWSVDGKAHKYEIRLYRDGRRVSTKTVTSRSHNYTSEMSRGDHDYYFEVRPYNNSTGWGEWEDSDVKYVQHADPYYPPGSYVPGGDTSGGPGESTGGATPQIIYNPAGQWVSANNYWHFLYSNGVYASNSWIQLGNLWYYVDSNTNMAVGLVNIGGSTYYFNPDGTMATGTIILNGITRYFDANGKMVY